MATVSVSCNVCTDIKLLQHQDASALVQPHRLSGTILESAISPTVSQITGGAVAFFSFGYYRIQTAAMFNFGTGSSMQPHCRSV